MRFSPGNMGIPDKSTPHPDLIKAAQEDAAKHAFKSGATSSELKPGYHFVCRQFVKTIAQRFQSGAAKHGAYNYRKGIYTRDSEWLRDRLNHVQEHFDNLLSGTYQEEGFWANIGAVGWGLSVLCEAWLWDSYWVGEVLAQHSIVSHEARKLNSESENANPPTR